ncbi:MAG: M48 family metallopeptidase [Verrucomicrobiota bacterium]|nr:M48 family metallopeptidase [Verrucomicrobiota bacterium]
MPLFQRSSLFFRTCRNGGKSLLHGRGRLSHAGRTGRGDPVFKFAEADLALNAFNLNTDGGQQEFLFTAQNGGGESLATGEIVFRRSGRARRYRLTLRRDGLAVATIPRRGSEREARRFVERHRAWLEQARARQARRPRGAEIWAPGTRVLWRGELEEIRTRHDGQRPAICVGPDEFHLARSAGNLRPTLEAQFARRAKIELPARTWELAAVTGMNVKRVTVRNQRARWGSCSSGGAISLNWRLVQTPAFVRDYIIYHELIHLREMNHSARFWACVAEVCPDWRKAERWIKRRGSLLDL